MEPQLVTQYIYWNVYAIDEKMDEFFPLREFFYKIELKFDLELQGNE